MPSSKLSSRRVFGASSKATMAANTTPSSSSVSAPTKELPALPRASKPEIQENTPKKASGLSASAASDMRGKASVAVTTSTLVSNKTIAATTQTSKSKPKIPVSKIPLRATCEDVSDDHVNPNVYVTPPAGAKATSNPKLNSKAAYRDIPASEIDMNPKSPKSPKTENNPTVKDAVSPKKKKKGKKKKKSKDVPPAKIRSPTQEEKQARMVELYKLYDNPFQKQYERIKERELLAYHAGEGAVPEQDVNFAVNMGESRDLELDDPDVAKLLNTFADSVHRSRVRGTAIDTKPVTDLLQGQSIVKVDVRTAVVSRAQDFWSEPNAVLGREGKNLSNNFKAALDRAAGGKINTMAVVSNKSATNEVKASTSTGGENKREADGLSAKELGLKGSEDTDKLGDGIPALKIGTTNIKNPKGKATKIGSRVIKSRVKRIIEDTVASTPDQLKLSLESAFPQPVFDDSWFTPDIIVRVFKHPNLLAKKPSYGTDINTCIEYTLQKIYPSFKNGESESLKILILVNWVNSCAALWGLIGEKCSELNFGGGFGLWSLSGTICVMIPEAARPGKDDYQMLDDTMSSLTILSLWFIEEYSWAYGNFKETAKSAEEVFPDDNSLIQAFGYAIGTKHLRFPAREKVIQASIAQYPWFEKAAVEVEAEAEPDEMVEHQDDFETFKPKTNTMSKYGRTIPEIMASLQPILEGFSDITDDPDEQALALATFLDGGTSLWNLIHLQVSKEEQAAGKGLPAMLKAVWYAVGNKRISMDERMNIVRRHTMWFITHWMTTGGDMKVIKERALKALPNGEDDLMAFMEKDRQYVKAILHPEKYTVQLPTKPQIEKSTPKVVSAALPTTIPEALVTTPEKAAKALQATEVSPPVPKHTMPVQTGAQTHLTIQKPVQDFDRFHASPLTPRSGEVASGSSSVALVKKAFETKAVEVTRSLTVAVPQKAVVSHVIAEPKFEMPEVKGKGEAEQDDFDVNHESMEYIAPSSVFTNSATSLSIVPASREVNAAENNVTSSVGRSPFPSSISNTPSSILDRPSPVTNNNSQKSTHQDSTTDTSEKMQNTTAPPTPPMTSEELSPQPDLHTIHNTLATLSSTLAAIHSALYGTSSITTIASPHPDNNDKEAFTTIKTGIDAELNTNAQEAGLILVSACLSAWLKDAQSQIVAIDTKVSALSTKIDDLASENKVVKNMVEELITMAKSGRETSEEEQGEGENLLQVLLEEVRDVKEDMETLSRVNDGEELNGKALMKWLEKAKEMQGVMERAREAGELREVLWPQGDGILGEKLDLVERKAGRGRISGELREKVVAARELYVKIGNQAGRGQGGGGFCAIM
ncbi:hypothetical protein ONS96_014831 [Cadophora gregata f. sp. sojae]|nr:hypothetical protein ONS96_014831 [Cadophora gregata f. sp. sojae]